MNTPQLMPIVLALAGLIIILVPPKKLLSWDRRTGYWIYKRILDKTGDEIKAVRAAGIFYKIFGLLFCLFSLSFLIPWS